MVHVRGTVVQITGTVVLAIHGDLRSTVSCAGADARALLGTAGAGPSASELFFGDMTQAENVHSERVAGGHVEDARAGAATRRHSREASVEPVLAEWRQAVVAATLFSDTIQAAAAVEHLLLLHGVVGEEDGGEASAVESSVGQVLLRW